MEAIVFTAQGDMRQALNNLQSTHEGFGLVKAENVFKVELELSTQMQRRKPMFFTLRHLLGL